jgi:hypothetical protein
MFKTFSDTYQWQSRWKRQQLFSVSACLWHHSVLITLTHIFNFPVFTRSVFLVLIFLLNAWHIEIHCSIIPWDEYPPDNYATVWGNFSSSLQRCHPPFMFAHWTLRTRDLPSQRELPYISDMSLDSVSMCLSPFYSSCTTHRMFVARALELWNTGRVSIYLPNTNTLS